jgi:hypothetical protein
MIDYSDLHFFEYLSHEDFDFLYKKVKKLNFEIKSNIYYLEIILYDVEECASVELLINDWGEESLDCLFESKYSSYRRRYVGLAIKVI